MKNKLALNGKEYWRSLDQLADTPAFRKFLESEFPEEAKEAMGAVSRRKFLSLMGASFALAGLAGCRRPVEKILPYVKAPENIIAGKPLYYATTMPAGLNSYGIVVESHVGRPTKIEGNVLHPASKGKSSGRMQAEILNLYDPDRAQYIRRQNSESSWEEFVSAWQKIAEKESANKGEKIAVISKPFHSPTLKRLYDSFIKKYPKAAWVTYEPVSDENIYSGLKQALGDSYQALYHFEKANVILSLDADFLLNESDELTAARGFSAGRKVSDHKSDMNRLYVAENNYSITGAMADHRLKLSSAKIKPFLAALAVELQKQGLSVRLPAEVNTGSENHFDHKWLSAVAGDLLENKGSSLIVSGRRQDKEVHALTAALNHALNNTGKTVEYILMENTPSSSVTLKDVYDKIKSGAMNTVILLDVNPVYDSAFGAAFGKALSKVSNTIQFSSHFDETAQFVQWHIPAAHFLESWGDAQSFGGAMSIIQPLIQPLFGGIGAVEFMNLITTSDDLIGYDLVRATWEVLLKDKDFEKIWRRTLHDGVYKSSAPEKKQIRFRTTNRYKIDASQDGIEVNFYPSPGVYDGRYANNGWIQELSDPLTKVVWDNPALISPKTAGDYNLKNGDMIALELKGKSLQIPIWILPGHAENSVSLSFGYGRQKIGRIGNYVGVDVNPLLPVTRDYFSAGGKITPTGKHYDIVNTQDHGSMEGRPLAREATLKEFKEHPEFAREMVEHPPLRSIWEEHKYDSGYQWGMAIDLNNCIGCNACTIACQSENNIPVVGKELVAQGREMSWIRLDRYFSGPVDDPQVIYQPVACQHCEMAPCEQVCPVVATSHDDEGLNVMTYNRCIGTRYCANNCPYKVRRFNYFNFTKDYPEVIKLAQNPDVTVRSRGVMEKCTYCTQRINQKKIEAKNEGRTLKDGEVLAACQQSCPADAISFGNILDKESAVYDAKADERNYALLGELNVKPRTSFLAKLRNPNPKLEKTENA